MNKYRVAHYHLLTVIVNRGRAAKVVQIAKHEGVPGATISLGWGTIRNRFFDFLGVAGEDKDIVTMASDPDTIKQALEALATQLQMEKPNHGIAYVMELTEVSGIHRQNQQIYAEEQGDNMNQLITVIVDRGRADDVMAAAKAAGAPGGTIVNARGSGVHESQKIFNMEVVPEKEMVLILCDQAIAQAIMTQIETDLQIHEPGRGIMYLQPVLKSVGARK